MSKLFLQGKPISSRPPYTSMKATSLNSWCRCCFLLTAAGWVPGWHFSFLVPTKLSTTQSLLSDQIPAPMPIKISTSSQAWKSVLHRRTIAFKKACYLLSEWWHTEIVTNGNQIGQVLLTSSLWGWKLELLLKQNKKSLAKFAFSCSPNYFKHLSQELSKH